jgi:hypothetical protein
MSSVKMDVKLLLVALLEGEDTLLILYTRDEPDLSTIYSSTSIVIVPSMVHFSLEKMVIRGGGGKTRILVSRKREAEKRSFGACESDFCRNWGDAGERKGIFARFGFQNKQKER